MHQLIELVGLIYIYIISFYDILESLYSERISSTFHKLFPLIMVAKLRYFS